MIFLTVGTQLPFNRLVRAIDEWASAPRRVEIVGQLGRLGPNDYRPRHFEWCELMGPVEFQGCMRRAELVASHAGMGTIIGALTSATPLLIMPRRAPIEHRNDHQMATVNRLANRLRVRVAYHSSEVAPSLENLLTAGNEAGAEIGQFAQPELIDAIREQILLAGGRAFGEGLQPPAT